MEKLQNFLGITYKQNSLTMHDYLANAVSSVETKLGYKIKLIGSSFIKDNNFKKINFLKIDCEGGEFDIFKNISKDFLRDNVDKIVCEVHAFGAFSQRDYEEIIERL